MTARTRPGPALRTLLALGALCLVPCCGSVGEGSIDGETHFLMACQPEGSDCDSGLRCVCGVCTRPCERTLGCTDLNAAAECVQSGDLSTTSCEDNPGAACDVLCGATNDCNTLGPGYRCASGVCRPNSVLASTGTGGSAGVSGSVDAATTTGGLPVCPEGDVAGNEVVVLGDVFVAQTHEITTQLEALARENGALGPDESYRDYSSTTANSLTLNGALLLDRFLSASAEGPVKVVIMNGGGTDVVARSCPGAPTPDCPLMIDAIAGAEQLLSRMVAAGVENVVWFYYPGPTDPDLLAKLDVLRPLLVDVCANSAVPCHWVELRPTFEGHYDEYMMGNFVPSKLGAQAAAATLWASMQQACVAQ